MDYRLASGKARRSRQISGHTLNVFLPRFPRNSSFRTSIRRSTLCTTCHQRCVFTGQSCDHLVLILLFMLVVRYCRGTRHHYASATPPHFRTTRAPRSVPHRGRADDLLVGGQRRGATAHPRRLQPAQLRGPSRWQGVFTMVQTLFVIADIAPADDAASARQPILATSERCDPKDA